MGTKLEPLERVLGRSESNMESGFYPPGGRRTMGSHSILFYFFQCGTLETSMRFTHAYPFTLCLPFPVPFSPFPFFFLFWCMLGRMSWKALKAIGV